MIFLELEKLKQESLKKQNHYLEEAIKSDSNNVWLFVQLAKISLKQKDSESFNRYLQNGREIYPQYEPFFLLEAQYLYDRKNIIKAKKC